MLSFPLFGGVSREKDYFKLDVIEGDAAAAEYLEQWLRELRIFFDRGPPIKTWDALRAGPPPPGASRVVRVEMDFAGPGNNAKATLTWPADQ